MGRLMLVRRAECQDACQAADVIRRSITELCATEYRNDRRVLACWLANKTEENLRRWIDQTDRSVFVAVRDDGQLAAVGMVTDRGEIQLNYVAPEARFLGASKSLVAHMEAHLRTLGTAQAVLLSTQVARQFYRSIGYEEGEQVQSRFGTLDGTKMIKLLS